MSQQSENVAASNARRSFAVDIDTKPMVREANLANWKSLIRLRWAAVAGQLLTAGLAVGLLGFVMPWVEFLVIVAVEIVANIAAVRLTRLGHVPTAGNLAGAMILDLLALTGLLFVTGGVENPFNFLFVIHIALAAVFLRQQWLWAVVFGSVISFGLLFFAPSAQFSGAGQAPFSPEAGVIDYRFMDWRLDVGGTWTAFALAGICIAWFVGEQVKELRERERQVRIAEEMSQRSARLASLAALAAGAAHELSTPLSTIALVAGELVEEAQAQEQNTRNKEVREDAELIRAEVERCRAILDRLSADAGTARAGGLGTTSVSDFAVDVLDRLRDRSRVEVDMSELRIETLQYPMQPLVHAVSAVVQNGLHAAPSDQPVQLRFASTDDELRIEVLDSGVGMSREVLERATDPFFTTRPEGSGMGLGLFLARNVTETLGGEFSIDSQVDEGTTVVFRLPLQTPMNHIIEKRS